MMAENTTKKFILEFFKDSGINDDKGVLTITNVPASFEEFIGKKSPYKLVFDLNLHNKIKETELIMQGSYFLCAIKDYLANKGLTSLLKLNIKPDLNEIKKTMCHHTQKCVVSKGTCFLDAQKSNISNLSNPKVGVYFSDIKKNPKLKNSKIVEVIPADNSFLTQFSFLSSYQYLNEKKQSINKFLIKDKEILDIDITGFKSSNGKKEDIPEIDLTSQYNLAKRKLDINVIKDIKPIKSLLHTKLEKELFRIKDHYYKQIKEKDDEVEKCKLKIKLLKSKLKHTFYERDIATIKRTIVDSERRLEMLQKRSYRERLNSEEIFHKNDEIEKHVLSIKNTLINVTIYYYPIFDISVMQKGKKTILKYDPVLKRVL